MQAIMRNRTPENLVTELDLRRKEAITVGMLLLLLLLRRKDSRESGRGCMRVCGLDPPFPLGSRHSDVTPRWDPLLIAADNSFAAFQRGGNSRPPARRRISHFPLPECNAQTEQDGGA